MGGEVEIELLAGLRQEHIQSGGVPAVKLPHAIEGDELPRVR
jgi:hypothetical protein